MMKVYIAPFMMLLSLNTVLIGQTTQGLDLEIEVRRALGGGDMLGEVDPATYGARVLPILRSILEDRRIYSEGEKSRALLMLSRVRDQSKILVKPAVQPYLRSESPKLRRCALVAYRDLAASADAGIFVALLYDPDADVRHVALESFLNPVLRGNLLALQIWHEHARQTDPQRAENAQWLRWTGDLYEKVMKFQASPDISSPPGNVN
jgi:hypothetical protein